MLNPLKCIITAEFSFLKAFFGAGLGQKINMNTTHKYGL